MERCIKQCFGGGTADADDFLRQFEAQVSGEDRTWRGKYADARGLLAGCAAYERWGGDEEAAEPMSFLHDFREAVVQPQGHFDAQLALLDAHWASLRETLAACEQRELAVREGAALPRSPVPSTSMAAAADGDSDDSDRSARGGASRGGAVGNELLTLLGKLVENHYRGMLLLQVYQYWHRSLYDRCLNNNMIVQRLLVRKGEGWWNSSKATRFRSARTLTSRMQDTVHVYRNFLAVCDRRYMHHPPTEDEVESLLSHRRVAVKPTPREYMIFGTFAGFAACAIVFIILCLSSAPQAGYDVDTHLWRVMPLFRGLLVIYIAIWLWGVVMWMLDARRINYPYILGLTGENITSIHVFKIAGLLSAAWMICFALYIAHVRNGVSFAQGINPRCYVLANILVPVGVLLWPTSALVPVSTRLWLLRTLAGVLVTPFVHITFAINFITDYLTSMVKVLNDFGYITCTIYHGTILHPPAEDICARAANSYVQTTGVLCVLLPLSWRWLQCMRKNLVDPLLHAAPPRQHGLEGAWKVHNTSSTYTITYDKTMGLTLQVHKVTQQLTKEVHGGAVSYVCTYKYKEVEGELRLTPVTAASGDDVTAINVAFQGRTRVARRVERSLLHPHGLNTIKYMLSILPGIVGLLHSDWGSSRNGVWSWGRVVYVCTLCCSTMVSFYWDVFMDWGVVKREKFPAGNGAPVASWCSGWVWRQARISRAAILGIVLFDLLGRLAWSITLVTDPKFIGVTGLGNGELLFLVTATVEVTRRSLWALLRLGHEQEVDVGKYRAGDGYRNVPPLVSRKTPWTVPGELTVLQPLQVKPQELNAELNKGTVFQAAGAAAKWRKKAARTRGGNSK